MLGRRESGLARRGTEAITGRFDPWVELDQMRTRMDDLLSRFFGYTPLNRLIGPPALEPAVDICESPDNVMVSAYIPGLSEEELDLNVMATSITISGEWKHSHEQDKDIVCHVTGFGAGKFEATYTLPVEVDPNQAKAVYKDGVLRVTLPKTESYKSKSVKVDVGAE